MTEMDERTWVQTQRGVSPAEFATIAAVLSAAGVFLVLKGSPDECP